MNSEFKNPHLDEQSLQDIIDGTSNKQIYMNPDLDLDQEPSPYDYGEGPDYGLMTDDEIEDKDENESDEGNEHDDKILDETGLANYNDVEQRLSQQEINDSKSNIYLEKNIEKAIHKRNQLKTAKLNVNRKYNKGIMTNMEKHMNYDQIDNATLALRYYILHYKTKLTTIKGSGMKNRLQTRVNQVKVN